MKVEFTVLESSIPFTAGIPLKKNEVFSTAGMRLKNAAGTSVPFAATVLSRWSALKSTTSASIKWLSLDIASGYGNGTYTIFGK